MNSEESHKIAMTDLAGLRASCQRLGSHLEAHPHGSDLRAVYLDLAPIVGQLQAAVSQAARSHAEPQGVEQAVQALERVKASSKKVGLDMRLSSDSAFLLGLQAVLHGAEDTLDALEALR